MKKTLLSLIAGLAVINAANAGIKETCLEHPDKLVWVEKTQRCIPINPCTSDDEDIRKAYCIDDYFLSNYYLLPKGNISLTSADVINIYVNNIGLNCTVSETEIQKIEAKSKGYGYDHVFVPCKGTDYRMFQFASDSAANVTDIFCGLIQAPVESNYGGHATRCDTSRESCDIIKKLIGDKITVEYKQPRNPEFWFCYIGEDAETTVDGFMWTTPIDVNLK